MMVTFVFVMIMIAGASTDRITEVLDEIPEMIDPADAVTSVADGDIVFDHVSFSYAGEEKSFLKRCQSAYQIRSDGGYHRWNRKCQIHSRTADSTSV